MSGVSAMRRAAAAITGGTICPPVLFIASIPPATAPLKPVAFISGMLITPSTMTFAAEEPLTVPNMALAPLDTFAGPPRRPPGREQPRQIRPDERVDGEDQDENRERPPRPPP